MQEVREYLLKNSDKKYQEFSKNLSIGKEYKSIGVRIPLLRNYAKVLSKKYSLDYLINNIPEEYYEEVLLKGFIIGNYKNLEYDELIYYINNHLSKITDWSMCDTFVASLKIVKKYQGKLWQYIIQKLNSKREFDVRFSLVMILNYYISDEYKEKIYDVIKNIKLDDYYVKMANAWLISYMFINYYRDTISFIKNNKFDRETIKKGINKAIESRQLTKEQKDNLRQLRLEV